MSTPITTSAPRQASIWEDFVDIFVSPSVVFERRQNGGFFVPLLVLTVVMVVLYIGTKPLLQPIFDAEFARQTAAAMQAHPEMTAARLESGRKLADTFGFINFLIGIPIMVLITGLVLWFVGKLFDAAESVGAAMMVATFAFFPGIFDFVVKALQAAVMDPAQLTSQAGVSLSLARFMDPDTSSRLLLALAGHVDVFVIWTVVLLAIGLSVTGKISRQRAAIAGAIIWILGALPALFVGMMVG